MGKSSRLEEAKKKSQQYIEEAIKKADTHNPAREEAGKKKGKTLKEEQGKKDASKRKEESVKKGSKDPATEEKGKKRAADLKEEADKKASARAVEEKKKKTDGQQKGGSEEKGGPLGRRG